MNIFAQITKKGLTFRTVKGNISVQDLWSVPLTNPNGFSLDAISRELLKTTRATAEESLVSPSAKVDTDDELRIEVLKFIIADKQVEAEAAQNFAKKQERKRQLQELIAKKQQDKMEETPLEDLMQELSEL